MFMLLTKRSLIVLLPILLFLNFVYASANSTARVSIDSSGIQANGNSESPSLNGAGNLIVFSSIASNLVPGDTNQKSDVFVKNLQTDATTRVSTTSSGEQATDGSNLNPVISENGKFVVFSSDATNLVTGDTNSKYDVFLKNIETGATSRVSTTSSGDQSTGAINSTGSWPDAISADGRYIVFLSEETNLVPNDTNNVIDVFLKDTLTGTTTRVSADSNGNQANSYSHSASISSNGRYIAFSSFANNLVPNDTNGSADVFLKDIITGVTSIVSTTSTGLLVNESSFNPSISADGRYVAFYSYGRNLVSGDTNGRSDIFVKDILTGQTKLISRGFNSKQASGPPGAPFLSYNPKISADGRYVAFISYADSLVPNDTNKVQDIFVKDLSTNVLTRISTSSSGKQGNRDSGEAAISNDSRKVVFSSSATNLVAGDNNNESDIFMSIEKYSSITYAPTKSYAKRKGTKKTAKAKLYWKVASPFSNKAFVKLVIKKKLSARKYKKIKEVKYRLTRINKKRFYQFVTNDPGVYKFFVYATSPANDPQANIASNYLIVK